MNFVPTILEGSYAIHPDPVTDDRGWFARYFCKREFEKIGHVQEWVQMNHSYTAKKGTIRGMHFQYPPREEIKMVRCIAGAVFDVIIDLRATSATFLSWFGIELSAENKTMLYIPAGFAHGFQCLSEHCELLYHHSEFYTPGAEGGIRYDDPLVSINWPLPVTLVSERDGRHAHLDEHFKGI